MTQRRNKPIIHASVSPYIKDKADELVGRGDFGSMSDLVGIALAEFIGKYEKNKSEKCSNNEFKDVPNPPGVVIHNLE